MVDVAQYRSVFAFLLLYLLLSWVPFLYLNQELLDAVVERVSLVDPLTAVWVATAVIIMVGLLQAREGVDRYNQFLSAPTGLVSLFVFLSFVLAAVAWWAVPELVFHFELDVTLNQMLVLVLACQAPMLVFLSLLTVLGKATAR